MIYLKSKKLCGIFQCEEETKPILSCCDVINFGIGEGKGERKSLQRRWEKWDSPFPFLKFITSQQDDMGFIDLSLQTKKLTTLYNRILF